MDKMQIYSAVRAVPETAKKAFDNGLFKGTDINSMWRIKKLTELFGPCGSGWYYELVDKHCEEHNDVTMAIVDIKLYWNVTGDMTNPTWSAPIYGTGGNKLVYQTQKRGTVVSDEGYKMALTDAISVACKALGIGADVYYEKDASSKYSEYYTQQPKPQMTVTRKPTSAMLTVLENKTDNEQKLKLKEKYGANLEGLDYEACDKLLRKLGAGQ